MDDFQSERPPEPQNQATSGRRRRAYESIRLGPEVPAVDRSLQRRATQYRTYCLACGRTVEGVETPLATARCSTCNGTLMKEPMVSLI